MYLLPTILIPLFLLFFFLHLLDRRRRKKSIQKVCNLCMHEKQQLIDELLEPFGYCYLPKQDLFASRKDAWQREMGYCHLYDEASPHFHLIFDSLPVYFHYRNRTWLLEFWKGQYGINTGGEIGLYYADLILEETELETTLFQAVPDEAMLRMSFTLYRNGKSIAQRFENHWWLTAFRPGEFSRPADLTMCICVDFSSAEMARTFTKALCKTVCDPSLISCRCNSVTFTFSQSSENKSLRHRLQVRWAQFANRFWCKTFLSVTRPFVMSIDRVLYLYFYLPFAFRRMLHIRKYRKTKRKSGGHSQLPTSQCHSCTPDKRP